MKLSYKLSGHAAAELERVRTEIINIAAETTVSYVEIDLTDVESPDSLFLGQMLRLHLALRGMGAELKLTNLSRSSEMVFRNSSLDRVMRIPGASSQGATL